MLEIINLKASINKRDILKGLNLKINPGEVHAIMGPNGSGKSTLANILSGKNGYKISGDLKYKGENLKDIPVEQRAQKGIFLAFQYPVEIPGVNTNNFLKTSLNTIRKFKGLKDFGYVYITNGVSEAITVCMLEHNLRPIVNKDDYPGYMCQAIAFKDSLITLRNRTKFLSLPYYNTADEHPDTIETLQEKSFIDLAWAGGSGLQKTYDVGKTEYVSFSFSKMFGIQYHRIGILFSKKPIITVNANN